MKPVHEMTAAEALAEAQRRQSRREAGLPLDGPAMPNTMALDGAPIVKERLCDYCRKLGARVVLAPDAKMCPQCFREPLEKNEQMHVVMLYRAFGVTVYVLSQPRSTMQSENLPDLWCVHREKGVAWWHETKRTLSGKMRPGQQAFAEECAAAGVLHRYGGLDVARAAVVELLGVDPEQLPR